METVGDARAPFLNAWASNEATGRRRLSSCLQTLKDRETTNQPPPLPKDGGPEDVAMMSDLTINITHLFFT